MGYAFLIGPCLRCGQIFGCNPNLVPSMRPTPAAEKEPICRYCYDRLNRQRVVLGHAPWPEPHPEAYEPVDEREL